MFLDIYFLNKVQMICDQISEWEIKFKPLVPMVNIFSKNNI